MDFNKEPIYEIIEAVEEHAGDIRYSHEKGKVRRALPSLKEALLKPEIDPKMLWKAYDVMVTMQATTDVKFMNPPNEAKFFEAILGVSWEQGKDDLDFCNKYVMENKVDTASKRRYTTAWKNFGSMRGRYLLHQLREEWEGGQSQ